MDNMYFLNRMTALEYFKKHGTKVYGNMYKLPDGRLIKKYDENKSHSSFLSKDRLLDFKDVNIEGVSFIKALVYTGLFDVYATITRDVPGMSLKEMPLGYYQIDYLIAAIKKFENTIRELSSEGISATMDVYIGNIIYDGKTLTLIDTAEYYYKSKSTMVIYEDNMLALMNDIFFNIFSITGYTEIYYLKEYFKMRGSKYIKFDEKEFLLNPSETLTEIRNLFEEDFGLKINTFNESHILVAKAVEKEKTRRRVCNTSK